MADESIIDRAGASDEEIHQSGTSMIGLTIGGQFVIRELIGEGGMGAVYRAEKLKPFPKQVAIKVLAKRLTYDPDFRKRFFEEANNHAALDHPNIVNVSDFLVEDGEYFLVMAYVKGQSLSKLIKDRGKLGEEEALRIATDMLRGLDHVHRNGIFHRDVKPSNILIDETGRALLTDFGIAIRAGDPRLTGSQVAIGTPVYMSPEQILHPEQIDHRSDVYSAAIVLFEMLTGQVPFDGQTEFVVKEQQVKARPPSPRKLNRAISRSIAQAILRALEKNPDNRYSGCADFLGALTHPAIDLFWWKWAGVAAASLVASWVIFPIVRDSWPGKSTPPNGETTMHVPQDGSRPGTPSGDKRLETEGGSASAPAVSVPQRASTAGGAETAVTAPNVKQAAQPPRHVEEQAARDQASRAGEPRRREAQPEHETKRPRTEFPVSPSVETVRQQEQEQIAQDERRRLEEERAANPKEGATHETNRTQQEKAAVEAQRLAEEKTRRLEEDAKAVQERERLARDAQLRTEENERLAREARIKEEERLAKEAEQRRVGKENARKERARAEQEAQLRAAEQDAKEKERLAITVRRLEEEKAAREQEAKLRAAEQDAKEKERLAMAVRRLEEEKSAREKERLAQEAQRMEDEKQAVSALLVAAYENYAHLCRDVAQLEKKEEGKRLSNEAGESALVDQFEIQIGELKRNLGDYANRYGEQVASLSRHDDAILESALREKATGGRAQYFDWIRRDYQQKNPTHRANAESMQRQCASQ
jgi:serine/threonine protein kinase